jgi:ankyrin repeat protein
MDKILSDLGQDDLCNVIAVSLESGNQFLFNTLASKHKGKVAEYLKDEENQKKALFSTCRHGNPNLLAALKGFGTNLEAVDSKGNTCLHMAAVEGNIQVT